MRYCGGMRAGLIVVVALAVGIAAGGCHRAPAPPAEVSTTAVGMRAASPEDMAFLERIVIHHQQALELTDMVGRQSTDAQLLQLADQIAAQQRTQLQGCQAQLLQWEAPGLPADQRDPATIAGMVDQATLDKLRGLSGPEFGRMWLTTMIDHHRGAITMARQEMAVGQSPEAVSIAQSLVPLQQAEIDQMNRLLGEP